MLILLLPLAAGLLVRGTHPWTADPTTIFCTWPGSSRYAREVSGYRHTGRVAREVPFRVGPTGGNRDATSAPRRSAECPRCCRPQASKRTNSPQGTVHPQ
jgi:hypothetical protein